MVFVTYLFVLIMDFLRQLIQYNILLSQNFKFHWKCDKLKISHLCFADDLLLLFCGDVAYTLFMKDSLTQFYECTGLLANRDKSCNFLARIEDSISDSICQTLQFSKGSLPVKYLGIPLITTQMKKRDCDELVQRIRSRILSWTSKLLSYAGRLQLIQSVHAGIQN